MTKAFAVLIFTFASVVASAVTRADSGWVLISSVTEKAGNSAEFIVLQDKYPEIFGEFESTNVVSANVEFKNWEYQDKSVCPANDPRLKSHTVTYGVCEKHGQTSQCFQTATLVRGGDPCLP